MSFSFDRPEFLWALLLLIPIVLLARASKRRIGTGRMLMAAGTRIALLLAIVFALAGFTRHHPVDALGVVFVLDRSASVGPEGRQRAEAFVREALTHRGDDDVAGVVAFGADAMLESEPRADLHFEGVESVPSPHQTDVEAGLRLATAALPADRSRRIVLLSDGEETRGDAVSQVLLSAGEDLEISVVPLTSRSGPEVLLEDLLAPARVDQDASYEVKVVARSELPASGKLRLYRNDEYLGEMPVELDGGRAQVLSFRQEAGDPGLYRYRATLSVDDGSQDTIPQNNEVVSTVQVTGQPRVLYAEGYPDQAKHLASALRKEGVQVDVVSPEDIPAGPSGLRPYATVILSDVPAYALSRRQQEALQAYVRDLGRGLIMVGGDQSFGLGGYYATPIEEALPVRMDLKDKTRFPKLAMVLAIDKSCSMGGGAGSKLGMAKEAGIQTAQLLSDRDLLGVIGFDGAASWIVPLLDLSNRDQVVSTIGGLRSGGGTDIYPAVERGVKGLKATDAALKHLIILSDGITSGANYQALMQGANADQITISAISIGADSDTQTMRDFATWGGGNYYLVTDPTSIPAIFTRETMLATRSFLMEEPIRPAMFQPSDVLKGMKQEDFVVMGGMVATEPKPRATVALVHPEDAKLPVLAHWNYGLGRSVAFTSDSKARWSSAWLGTADYTQFWTQVVRWSIGSGMDGSMSVDAEIRDGELVISVDAYTNDGDFRNFLEGEARVVAPDLTVRPLELRQVAPGRYEAATPIDQDGSWLAGVSLKQGDVVVGQAVAEAVQPYSPEYRSRGGGGARMRELGSLGGGGELAKPADVFKRPKVARQVPQPLWNWLILLAGFLLLLDVMLRRLDFSAMPSLAPKRVTDGSAGRLASRPRRAPVPRADLGAGGDGTVQEVVGEVMIEDDTPVKPELDIPADSYAGRLLAARRSARKKMG
ncbi:MAG: VWA domain-containing protein, partial [Proteobacteria bacterium]|nr:VWA domain-containing protein [Pseudomonadota bacterium]